MGNVYRRGCIDPDHVFPICYSSSNLNSTHSNEKQASRGTNIGATEHSPSPANDPHTRGYRITSYESSAYSIASNEPSSYRSSAYYSSAYYSSAY